MGTAPQLSDTPNGWKILKGVGIDHFSIGGFGDDNFAIHRTILEANIWVVEGIQLDNPELLTGQWHIISLPMKIRDCSGAPSRVVAIQYE